MNQEESLKLDNQICFPLYAVSRLLTRAYQPLLKKLDLTYPQYLVLLLLWEKDGLTVNDIAHKLYLNTNTITPLLKRMEFISLLRRERSKADERSVNIFLTQKSLELKELAYCVPEAILEQVDVPKEDLIHLRATLKELMNKFDKID